MGDSSQRLLIKPLAVDGSRRRAEVGVDVELCDECRAIELFAGNQLENGELKYPFLQLCLWTFGHCVVLSFRRHEGICQAEYFSYLVPCNTNYTHSSLYCQVLHALYGAERVGQRK